MHGSQMWALALMKDSSRSKQEDSSADGGNWLASECILKVGIARFVYEMDMILESKTWLWKVGEMRLIVTDRGTVWYNQTRGKAKKKLHLLPN